MLRKTIISYNTNISLDLPEEYLGKEIEILVFPVSLNEETIKPLVGSNKMDFSLFDKYKGTFDGNFNRESCYDRKVLS